MPRYNGENGITEVVKLYLKDEDVMQVQHRYISPQGPALTRRFISKTNSTLLPQPPETQDFTLRADQLSFRKHEIYYAFDAFKRLLSGEERLCVQEGSAADIDWESWCRPQSKSVKVPVNCDQLTLAGHSFGGATIVSTLDDDTA